MSGPPGTEHLTDEEFVQLMTAHGHRWGKSFMPLNMMAPICIRCLASFDKPEALDDCLGPDRHLDGDA